MSKVKLILATGAAVTGAFVLSVLTRYARTYSGKANNWTLEAMFNALRVSPYLDKATKAVNATITSMYRSPEVNSVVGGNPKSKHLRGLAADIVVGSPQTAEAAGEAIIAMARRGELGALANVGWEQRINSKGKLSEWLHLDWHESGATGAVKTWRLRAPNKPPKYEAWNV